MPTPVATLAPTTPVRPLTLPQRRLLDTWRMHVGIGAAHFADVFESELSTGDNHDMARLIGLFQRLVNAGVLVADNPRRPEHLWKYRAVA